MLQYRIVIYIYQGNNKIFTRNPPAVNLEVLKMTRLHIFMEGKAPVAIPFHEKPSIVEIVLPLALFYAATEPAYEEQPGNKDPKVTQKNYTIHITVYRTV